MSTGLIGLGSIGKNLAINIAKNDDVHVYNRSPEKSKALAYKNRNIHDHSTLEELVNQMAWPRRIITTLPNGYASDAIIYNILPMLDQNDTIIDCSNEYYRNSRRRGSICSAKGVNYMGVGLSGGSKGALEGPALMIGSDKQVYKTQRDFFETLGGNYTYMGHDFGIGHFTKMVHNGVEYGMLQGVADIFAYCNQDIASMNTIMSSASKTDIDGFIVKCAIDVLNKYKLHKISDLASMNNTGLWCSQTGFEYEIPTPVINAAVNARLTTRHSKAINVSQPVNPEVDIQAAVNALRFVYASAIQEGYDLMATRGVLNRKVSKAWSTDTIIECPLVNNGYQEVLEETFEYARQFAVTCNTFDIPCPAVSAALTKYNFMHQRRTSTNFIMAQRNFFGEHTLIDIA